jgi:putative NADH-flavin reductase
MQLTIFGASGGTGRRLVEQAPAAGHTVTAWSGTRPGCRCATTG